MSQNKFPNKVHSLTRIYDLDDLSIKFVLVVHEELGERLHIEFSPNEFYCPHLYDMLDLEILDGTLLDFEIEREKFLGKKYPKHLKGRFL